jgi:thiol:disulfide interchange protein
MKKLFVLLLIVGGISSAFISKNSNDYLAKLPADEGILFEKMNLADALKEAKKTGKLIFVDCYTEWCGPCKKMAATSFMDKNVASAYNSKFINLKVEMEKSEDGPEMARMYGVRAYPTLLFLNGDGKVVKTIVGFQTADQLIAASK